MSIGTNLRKLRAVKGLTQEQAAEVFGVSAQAVSRWENDTAYPDVTALCGIAAFYDTSVDALLDVDARNREENLRRIHAEAQRQVAAGDIAAAEAALRAGLRRFPAESGLMLALAETLSQKNDEKAALEAVRLSERALCDCELSLKARATTLANLVFLYRKMGKTDEAAAIIPQLPHLWESREVLAAEVQPGAAALRELIEKVLVFLCLKIDSAEKCDGETPAYIQLGVDFSPQTSAEAMLKKLLLFMKKEKA